MLVCWRYYTFEYHCSENIASIQVLCTVVLVLQCIHTSQLSQHILNWSLCPIKHIWCDLVDKRVDAPLSLDILHHTIFVWRHYCHSLCRWNRMGVGWTWLMCKGGCGRGICSIVFWPSPSLPGSSKWYIILLCCTCVHCPHSLLCTAPGNITPVMVCWACMNSVVVAIALEVWIGVMQPQNFITWWNLTDKFITWYQKNWPAQFWAWLSILS